MLKSTKLLSSIALAFTLSACASVGQKEQVSENLNFAPAIDVSYNEVNTNIKEHIGVNVRWGGEIIASKKVGEITELTVFGHPLSNKGRPIPGADKNFQGGRFIVEVPEYEESLIRKYVTVYGQVSGEKTLVNGPKTKVIPVVTAIDSKNWKPEILNNRRGIAYYSLGYRTGHFNSFGRFGHRGFSRFGRGYYSGSRYGHRGAFFKGRRH